jgi:hypothetical protein
VLRKILVGLSHSMMRYEMRMQASMAATATYPGRIHIPLQRKYSRRRISAWIFSSCSDLTLTFSCSGQSHLGTP